MNSPPRHYIGACRLGADHRWVTLAGALVTVDPPRSGAALEAENVVDLTEPAHRPVLQVDHVGSAHDHIMAVATHRPAVNRRFRDRAALKPIRRRSRWRRAPRRTELPSAPVTNRRATHDRVAVAVTTLSQLTRNSPTNPPGR